MERVQLATHKHQLVRPRVLDVLLELDLREVGECLLVRRRGCSAVDNDVLELSRSVRTSARSKLHGRRRTLRTSASGQKFLNVSGSSSVFFLTKARWARVSSVPNLRLFHFLFPLSVMGTLGQRPTRSAESEWDPRRDVPASSSSMSFGLRSATSQSRLRSEVCCGPRTWSVEFELFGAHVDAGCEMD